MQMAAVTAWSRQFRMVMLVFSSRVRIGRQTGERLLPLLGSWAGRYRGCWLLYLPRTAASGRFIPDLFQPRPDRPAGMVAERPELARSALRSGVPTCATLDDFVSRRHGTAVHQRPH